ncbi:MAG: peptidase, partial [Campylobacter sp.]|nr:peptidase [Campylobacter sp.]
DDATLADFARKGYISLIDAHIRSLSNLQNLAAKILENESKTANENK